MADQGICAVQNIAATAVVLLEFDLVLHPELAHEISHIANAGSPKGINALVIVADGHHAPSTHRRRRIRVQAGAGKHLDPGVLQLVGVLEFINQDVTKTPLIVFANRLVIAQQLITAQHQFAKINHALFLALLFVQMVDFNFLAGIGVMGLHRIGSQAVFLATADKPLCFFGRISLIVDTMLLVQAFDRAKLILRVQDLKGLRQVGHFVMGPQKPVAKAMKGANPHAADIDWQHCRQARHHLLGRLVGKGDRQYAAGRDRAVLQQPGNSRGQNAGFTRTGAGQNQRVFVRQNDSGALFRIEMV